MPGVCSHDSTWTPVGRLKPGEVVFELVCDGCGAPMKRVASAPYAPTPTGVRPGSPLSSSRPRG